MLEKERAARPSVLAWKTPWTEEPCGLQSMESQESDRPSSLNNITLENVLSLYKEVSPPVMKAFLSLSLISPKSVTLEEWISDCFSGKTWLVFKWEVGKRCVEDENCLVKCPGQGPHKNQS